MVEGKNTIRIGSTVQGTADRLPTYVKPISTPGAMSSQALPGQRTADRLSTVSHLGAQPRWK